MTVMMAAIFACSGQNGDTFDPAQYPVAIAMSNITHPVHRLAQLGFLQAAQKYGYTDAKIIGTERDDYAEVFPVVDEFAAKGGKGVLLWGNADAATYAKLSSMGVVIGTPHFDLRENGKLPAGLKFNLAGNPDTYGKEVAEFIAARVNGKQGSIAITKAGPNVTEDRAAASFIVTIDSLKSKYDLSKIKILPVQNETAVMDQAVNINLANLKANKDILAAFSTTGGGIVSWADAASKAGKKDGEIIIVGMDAIEANLNYLDQGKCAAIAAQPLYEEGSKAMEYLDTIFRGGTVPEWTDLKTPIVTKDGQGENGIAYHRQIASQVAAFFK
jgi:ribose transport system substrate-binding protein